MPLTTNRLDNCEWCGERLSVLDKKDKALKDGETVFYHVECLANDLFSIDYNEDPETGLVTW